MATYRGMDGSITFAANVVAEVKSWSLTSSLETLDGSKMGDAWRIFVGGMGTWSGQATCNLDYGDTLGQKAIIDRIATATPGTTSAALLLRQSATKTWGGNVFVTGFNITQALGQIVEAQLTFQGTGALSLAWA